MWISYTKMECIQEFFRPEVAKDTFIERSVVEGAIKAGDELGEFNSTGDIQALIDISEMGLHGVKAEFEGSGDLNGCSAGGSVAGDLELASRERCQGITKRGRLWGKASDIVGKAPADEPGSRYLKAEVNGYGVLNISSLKLPDDVPKAISTFRGQVGLGLGTGGSDLTSGGEEDECFRAHTILFRSVDSGDKSAYRGSEGV